MSRRIRNQADAQAMADAQAAQNAQIAQAAEVQASQVQAAPMMHVPPQPVQVADSDIFRLAKGVDPSTLPQGRTDYMSFHRVAARVILIILIPAVLILGVVSLVRCNHHPTNGRFTINIAFVDPDSNVHNLTRVDQRHTRRFAISQLTTDIIDGQDDWGGRTVWSGYWLRDLMSVTGYNFDTTARRFSRVQILGHDANGSAKTLDLTTSNVDDVFIALYMNRTVTVSNNQVTHRYDVFGRERIPERGHHPDFIIFQASRDYPHASAPTTEAWVFNVEQVRLFAELDPEHIEMLEGLERARADVQLAISNLSMILTAGSVGDDVDRTATGIIEARGVFNNNWNRFVAFEAHDVAILSFHGFADREALLVAAEKRIDLFNDFYALIDEAVLELVRARAGDYPTGLRGELGAALRVVGIRVLGQSMDNFVKEVENPVWIYDNTNETILSAIQRIERAMQAISEWGS